MTEPPSIADADRQLPLGDEIFLDHVGHFVRDREAAGRALARAGFAPTPPSIQANPDGSPTGTGNVTAMLGRGYIEVLFKTADTPLGRELDMALGRYAGVHLAAFAVADAANVHQRLTKAGFRTRPLVEMQRPVDTPSGPDEAAFMVARVEPGEMAEGRIQILTHRTEQAVWQKRWLAQPNGAVGLLDLVIAVHDLDKTTARFQRFTGRPATANAFGHAIQLDRGRVQLMDAGTLEKVVGVRAPGLPFIAAYAVAVASLAGAEEKLRQGDIAHEQHHDVTVAKFPDDLGIGAWLFVADAGHLPWRERL
jgi:Glyoxalase-like domain